MAINMSAISSGPSPDELRQSVAWAGAYLDMIGREGVRRFLAGDQHSPPHTDVPPPAALLATAHRSGGPADALAIAVVALRVTTGMAWRWIGARYLMVDCPLAPDLEDLRGDGKKVTGKPYAEAARDAMTQLVRSAKAVGNDLAPGNAPGLGFDDIARRWDVSADLIGATVGPGAARWLPPSATQTLTHGSGRYFRVVAEHAAWSRAEV
ncbi:hypothetical protein [Egicoccus halophilus]|uniref:Uncharacterized protein n=1 Tax=Egicoccus halophilus TaxID=1670830 RepID=A0A8J3A9P1_9ACTN|nr:hypothetical protein [Egicoccus halophilus]GGI07888.1 hypothetical protein GCM10011354_26330 [Egicoccus halophilus]